jgi:hypothetical protein
VGHIIDKIILDLGYFFLANDGMNGIQEGEDDNQDKDS